MQKRVVIACPGRGSYTEKTLGSLDPAHAFVRRAEELRREYGLESLLELDGAKRFDKERHLRPAHASPLIYVVSMLDAQAAQRDARATAVIGNSMGWYTALAVAGALDFDAGFRLVQELALLQEQGELGGQVIYPLVDDEWRRSAVLAAQVEAALATSRGAAFPSIHLGGFAVLAGSDAGIAHLLRVLPVTKLGRTSYPFRLLQHGPYHTPLASGVAERARAQLSRLAFEKPRITLVDGRGVRFTPWSTDASELARYTLGPQIDAPFDFAKSLRVALREHAPDQVVLPGPGHPLESVSGQILVAEGWRGIHSRTDFEREQASPRAPVLSTRP